MDRAARLLRGTLRVRVESAFPERVLNLCGAHGIAFFFSNNHSGNPFVSFPYNTNTSSILE